MVDSAGLGSGGGANGNGSDADFLRRRKNDEGFLFSVCVAAGMLAEDV